MHEYSWEVWFCVGCFLTLYKIGARKDRHKEITFFTILSFWCMHIFRDTCICVTYCQHYIFGEKLQHNMITLRRHLTKPRVVVFFSKSGGKLFVDPIRPTEVLVPCTLMLFLTPQPTVYCLFRPHVTTQASVFKCVTLVRGVTIFYVWKISLVHWLCKIHLRCYEHTLETYSPYWGLPRHPDCIRIALIPFSDTPTNIAILFVRAFYVPRFFNCVCPLTASSTLQGHCI